VSWGAYCPLADCLNRLDYEKRHLLFPHNADCSIVFNLPCRPAPPPPGCSLERKWAESPTFLQQELLAWMQKAQAQALLRAWGQLQQECGLGPKR
jgi:hypothetical protein